MAQETTQARKVDSQPNSENLKLDPVGGSKEIVNGANRNKVVVEDLKKDISHSSGSELEDLDNEPDSKAMDASKLGQFGANDGATNNAEAVVMPRADSLITYEEVMESVPGEH